ncbi:hypothetical protein [uncultured Flavobacterium sp.]|uniref:hypothetical protein n=1 Tax=uncultured Flavobacterium sp. TaxID=165435 RepID=UPI0025CDF86D|nr:hypothetical protein [uncultured Flavobacterium sp.]
MLTIIDVIFRGEVTKINFSFLKELLSKNSEVRFNFPEIEKNIDYDLIINHLKSSEYLDIVFSYFELNFVPNIFVNLGLDNKRIELIFFLDIKNIDCKTYKEFMDKLIAWGKEFASAYNFDTFTCEIDNANEDQFYYKTGKYGTFYNKLL